MPGRYMTSWTSTSAPFANSANSVVQSAFLQPSTDLDHVEFVLVILDYAGGIPGADDTPIDGGLTGPGGALPGGEQPCIEPSQPAASPLVP